MSYEMKIDKRVAEKLKHFTTKEITANDFGLTVICEGIDISKAVKLISIGSGNIEPVKQTFELSFKIKEA